MYVKMNVFREISRSGLPGRISMNTLINAFHKRRVFFQMYLVVIAITLVTLISLGLIYYIYASQKLVNEYCDNDKKLLKQAENTLDNTIKTAFRTSDQIYGNSDFMLLIRDNMRLDQVEKKKILNELWQILTSNEYIDSVVLYINNGDEVYSTDYGITTLDNFPDKEFISEYTDLKGSLNLIDTRTISKSLFQDSPAYNYKVITLMRNVIYNNNGNNILLMINLDMKRIFDNSDLLKFSDKAEVMLTDVDSGSLIFGNRNSNLVSGVFNDKNLLQFIKSKDDTVSVDIDGSRYLINSITSKLFNAKFIWITPYSVLNNILIPIKYFCVIAGFIILLLALAVEILIAWRKTKPLDYLLNEISWAKNVSEGKKGIMKPLENFLKAIINNNYQLQDKLDKMIPVYRENFLKSLITVKSLNKDEICTRLCEYNIQFNSGYILYFHYRDS